MSQQPWGGQPAQQFPGQQPYGQPAPQGYAPQQPQQNPWGQAPQQGQPQAPAQQAVRVEVGEEFDDFFTGGVKGAPGFDFGATQNGGEKVIGSTILGTIVEMAKMQQRDFKTGDPLWWEPRSPGEAREPRMQVAITLQTELRGWQGVKPKLIPKDPSTDQPLGPEHDNGLRRVYAKGDLQRAINVACDKAGQKPRIGGKLAVAVRGFEPNPAGNDKVLYDAQYLPAPEKAPTDAFFTQAPPQQAPAQVAGYQIQPQQAPQFQQGGWVGTQQAPQQFEHQAPPVQGPPPGYAPPQGQGYAVNATPQAEPVQAPQHPSTLGSAPAPTTPPDFAQQGYAPQQPAAPAQIPSSQYAEPQF